MASGTEEKPAYDLAKRTFEFARDIRTFIKHLRKSISNIEDARQLVRASGSVGANYIEANEALSKKDFYFRIKICRKEAKESKYWLALIDTGSNAELEAEKARLLNEAHEITCIFGAIISKAN